MVFRRRHPLPIKQKLLGWLWPRSGLKRAWMYLGHRIARLPGTPYSIAAGFASGAAVSFTPFLGLHFLMGFAIAWLVRGNLFASALGTAVGNPWTFPIIFTITGQVGSAILGYDVLSTVPVWSMSDFLHDPLDYLGAFVPIVFPMLVGAVPIAIFVWFLFYFAMRGLISSYRERRRKKLEEKAKMRAEAKAAEKGQDNGST